MMVNATGKNGTAFSRANGEKMEQEIDFKKGLNFPYILGIFAPKSL
jgi:hypothetical protein